MRKLRFERLADDLADALRSVGIDAGPAAIPWINESRRADFRCYYTRAAEEAVYHRYRWVFDQGFYPRLGAGVRRPTRDPTRGYAYPAAD